MKSPRRFARDVDVRRKQGLEVVRSKYARQDVVREALDAIRKDPRHLPPSAESTQGVIVELLTADRIEAQDRDGRLGGGLGEPSGPRDVVGGHDGDDAGLAGEVRRDVVLRLQEREVEAVDDEQRRAREERCFACEQLDVERIEPLEHAVRARLLDGAEHLLGRFEEPRVTRQGAEERLGEPGEREFVAEHRVLQLQQLGRVDVAVEERAVRERARRGCDETRRRRTSAGARGAPARRRPRATARPTARPGSRREGRARARRCAAGPAAPTAGR